MKMPVSSSACLNVRQVVENRQHVTNNFQVIHIEKIL
jgi:hypothetical protein